MKNSKVELKKGDKITLSNGVELIVDYSGTDGSGCHCCDNNICDCYFSRYHAKFCEKKTIVTKGTVGLILDQIWCSFLLMKLHA